MSAPTMNPRRVLPESTIVDEEVCSNCSYYDSSYRDCRRSSPKAAAVFSENESRYIAVWPSVNKDDWCGEWRAP